MKKLSNKMRRYMEGEGAPPANPPAGSPPPTKTFDQKAVDDIVGKRLAEAQKKFDGQRQVDLERMKALETDASKVSELESQIAELNNRYKSKEELAADAWKKEKSAWEKDKTTLTGERDSWKKRWEEQTRDVALMAAAGAKEADVKSQEQVLWFLQPRAAVKQKIVEGKPVDEFEVRIAYPDTKDGKAITLDLTPEEAIKRMKGDTNRFGNLFNSGVNGGLGGNGGTGGKAGEGTLLGMSQEEFNKRYIEGTLPKKVK